MKANCSKAGELSMGVGILDKNEEKMAVILFQNLEKKISIVRVMSKATADRIES